MMVKVVQAWIGNYLRRMIMKKTLYVIIAFASVLAVSCVKDNIADSDKSGLPTSFTVSMPSLDNGVETKTGLIKDVYEKYNKLVWTSGNTIYVTTEEELRDNGSSFDYARYSTTGSGSTATFIYQSETGSITEGTNYVAIYTQDEDHGPRGTGSNGYYRAYIPTEQHYVANGIDNGVMPMQAYGNLEELNFNCLGNIIRLNLKNTGGSIIRISRIDLNSAGDGLRDAISGNFALRVAEGYPGKAPRYQYGLYKTSAGQSRKYINYYIDTPVTLGPTATAFNIVFSRYHGQTDDDFDKSMNITATIYYTVNGGSVQTKDLPLTGLNLDRIKELGKIYTFKEKDTSSWPS